MRSGGDAGLGWAGISGGEAVRLGRAVTQGVWADVCIARLTWFLWRPLACSWHRPSAPRARGEQGETALGGLEVLGQGRSGCGAAGEAVWAVYGRTMPVSVATPPAPRSRGPRSGRAADAWTAVTGRSPGRALPDSRAPGIFFFLSFLARWCSLARDSSAECRSQGEKGMGEGVGRSQRHTPRSRASSGKSDHRTVAAAAKETFSPRAARFQCPLPTQLAGSLSTFLQTGSLAVTGFQPGRGLGESSAYGGALAGASRSGACFLLPTPPRPSSVQALDRL